MIVITLGENGAKNIYRLLRMIHRVTPKSKIIFFSLPSAAENADKKIQSFDKEKFISVLDRYQLYRKKYASKKTSDVKKHYNQRMQSGDILNGWEYEMSRYGSPVFPNKTTGEPESIANTISTIKSNKSSNISKTNTEIEKFKKRLKDDGKDPEKIIKYINIHDEKWNLTKINEIPFSDGIHLTYDASKTILNKFKSGIDEFIKQEKIEENKLILNDKLLRILIRKIIS